MEIWYSIIQFQFPHFLGLCLTNMFTYLLTAEAYHPLHVQKWTINRRIRHIAK